LGFSFIKMEKDKLIILSGSSGGIGEEILKYFSKKYYVLALYNNNKPKIINKKIKFLKADFKKKIIIKNIFFKNKKIIFINLAAIKINKLFIHSNIHEWKNQFKINVDSFFEITKSILPEMIKKNWGRIINFSSTDGINGDIGIAGYAATKHSIHGFSKVLSKEYGRFGITTNVLILGNFNYGMFKNLSIKKKSTLLKKVPGNKTGRIKNIINAINFIINSDYVNGAEIKIDGGI
jgi:NAD(P)-dependent dehydrogenase (short-subunit alcohol dehydrogenase family)